MKKFLIFILVVLFAVSCAVQRQYASYNNVTVIDNGNGESAYYHHVYVKSFERGDTLSTISFVDSYNHLYIICGKEIVVETVLLERYGYNDYRYYGSRPYVIYHSPHIRPVPRYYPPRPTPRRLYQHNPNYRPSPGHRPNNPPRGNNRGGNSSHRPGGRR